MEVHLWFLTLWIVYKSLLRSLTIQMTFKVFMIDDLNSIPDPNSKNNTLLSVIFLGLTLCRLVWQSLKILRLASGGHKHKVSQREIWCCMSVRSSSALWKCYKTVLADTGHMHPDRLFSSLWMFGDLVWSIFIFSVITVKDWRHQFALSCRFRKKNMEIKMTCVVCTLR